VFLVSHLVQTIGQGSHAPAETGGSSGGVFVCLPGRVPGFPGPGAALAGGVEGLLGFGEGVAGGVKGSFGSLHRGQGFSERVLGRGEPAAQPG
jgi:hypothetical protein